MVPADFVLLFRDLLMFRRGKEKVTRDGSEGIERARCQLFFSFVHAFEFLAVLKIQRRVEISGILQTGGGFVRETLQIVDFGCFS